MGFYGLCSDVLYGFYWLFQYDVSDSLHLLQEEVIPENTLKFRDIIPISTYTGEGIEELKACVRKSLDEEAEQENADYRKKKLLLLQTSGEQQHRG